MPINSKDFIEGSIKLKINLYGNLRKMSSTLWGGLIETLETCEENKDITESNSLLKKLKENLTLLENSTTFEEIVNILSGISETDRNYLNSALLDEIFDTIKSPNIFLCCCAKNKEKALKFYNTKHLLSYFRIDEGLLIACIKGHTNIAKFLIEKITLANPNLFTKILDSCFAYVCMYGYEEILKLFLQYKFTFNNPTTFFSACSNGHKNILEILLKEFPTDTQMYCKLDDAAKNGHQDVIEFLLINKIYRGWNVGLYYASEKGYEKIVETLLKYTPPNDVDPDALLKAVIPASTHGYTKIVEFLIENGAPAGIALSFASQHGHKPLTEFLLERGETPNYHDVMMVVKNNHVEIIELFLDYDAIITHMGASILREAAECGHTKIVKLLVKHNVSSMSVLNGTEHAVETLMKCL